MVARALTPTQNHIKAAQELWALRGEPELIRNHQNAVFCVSTGQKPAILRFSDPAHRTLEELEAELEWISYLSDNDVSVAAPIRSTRQGLVEEIEEVGKRFFATVFEEACGDPLDETNMFSFLTLHSWGRELGKLHRLSMRYEPQTLRKPYHEYARYGFDHTSLKSQPGHVIMAIRQISEWLEGLPKNPTAFGMIHGDTANVYVQPHRVTFFDFDDCTYHWYAYDIASGLYSLMFDIEKSELDISIEECMEQFLKGYRDEQKLDCSWNERIPGFILYRTALLYQWLLAPKSGPLWVARIDDEWKVFLLKWAENKLSGELNLM